MHNCAHEWRYNAGFRRVFTFRRQKGYLGSLSEDLEGRNIADEDQEPEFDDDVALQYSRQGKNLWKLLSDGAKPHSRFEGIQLFSTKVP